MSKQTTLNNIYERYKSEAGDSRIDKLSFIKNLNDLLQRMCVTKPAEVESKIYYVDGFVKYSIPDDFREAIAVYSDNDNVVRYVSDYRFRLEVPYAAFTDKVNSGKRYLKIRLSGGNDNKSIITDCDSLTADGSWAITGGSSLAIDENTKEKGSGSLSFSVSGTQTKLTFTRSSVIDASDYTEHMIMRLFAWFPTLPSSVKLRVGNDSSNYFERTITAQANGLNFSSSEANELEFRESQATETGTVDKENIDWIEIEINFSSSTTDSEFRLDYIILAKPEAIDLEYYTNKLAIDSDGNLQDKITEDVNTTDEPIIKDYPDYIDTVINGLCSEFLRIKNPERARDFESRFREVTDQNKKIIGGLAWLNLKYPNRRANYKRIVTLPPLYRGALRSRKYG